MAVLDAALAPLTGYKPKEAPLDREWSLLQPTASPAVASKGQSI